MIRNFISFAAFSFALSFTCSSAIAATVITPGASDNTIIFEAELGTIDNTFGGANVSDSVGWEVDVATAPASPSSGSYVTNTENYTATFASNSLTYSINFQKTGSYTVWYRVGFTTVDFEDSNDNSANNDSFWYENGNIQSGTTFTQKNSIPVATDTWNWFNGGSAVINVEATGETDWLITSREDGFIIDRLAFVHGDETATVNAAFLDGLTNTTTVVPEPSAFALIAGFLGLTWVMIRRR